MRNDAANTESLTSAHRDRETLKFHFTPVDTPTPLDGANPHAKATTHVPGLVDALRARFGEAIEATEEYAGEMTVRVALASLPDVARFLYDEQGFTYLSDLGGIDRFTDEDRYEVFYGLIALETSKRFRLKVRVDEESMTLPSVTSVWRAAGWHEREAFDMFGLRFEGHEDLRRMFMPEDFEYYPLRKEFPLLGIPGSLPLPAQSPGGALNLDPFPAAHGSIPVKSYEETGPDKI